MSDKEYEVLSYIAQSGKCSGSDIIHHFSDTIPLDELNDIVSFLYNQKNVCIDLSKNVSIEPKGRMRLLEFENQRSVSNAEKEERDAKESCREAVRIKKRREDYSNDERRYRTQNKIAIIIPFITFILGMLIEHFFKFLHF